MSQRNAGSSDGRVWLVTGASRGLGRAIAEAVLEHGDRLVAGARDTGAVDDLVREHPGRAIAAPLDVTEADQARQAVAMAVEEFGRLDVVVNNAGYGHVGAVEELSERELRQQFEVNLFGVINVTRAALPRLREQGSGHLVQISSLNGVEALPGGAYYTASKFAIEGLSESLAGELAPHGVQVTIVEPGPQRTDFVNRDSAEFADPSEDYAGSVGEVREQLEQLDGNQPGDPARAARAIIEAVEADDPPLRLPLGQMAVEHISAKLREQLEQLQAWRRFSETTDFDSESEPEEVGAAAR